MNLSYEYDRQQAPKNGQTLLQVLIIAVFCVFALRLWYMQIHKGEYYADKARENRLRQEKIFAPRGLLRDRDGRLVAINEPAYALGLVREDVQDMDATLAAVSAWTGQPLDELQQVLDRGRKRVKPFEPLILVPDLSFEELARVEAETLRFPGLEIVIRPKRYYPQGSLLAHIMGFVAEASEKELECDSQLDLGDTVGKGGVENVLEQRLRGVKGLRQIEVDASGRRYNELVLRQSRAGSDLTLSIDLDLQEYATKLFTDGDFTGSVVVLEPTTGQVLAMVSTPTYDNNAFAVGLTPDEWAVLRDDERHPLQNRVTQSVYPPGSVFKLLVAGCGLSEGMLDPNETVYCPGQMKLGRRVFRCWKKWGHGNMNLHDAIIQSCDVYFYEMGKRLGVDRIKAFADACGLGRLTGIDLPHEKSGLVPSREWKRQRFGEGWQGGENLNLAIGQGYTVVSPLQVARFIGALVNGGMLMKPELVADDPPMVQGRLPLNQAQINVLLKLMQNTVEEDRGTARRLQTEGAIIGGKTGTAQVVKLTDEYRGKKTEEIPYKLRDHAWIASWGRKGDRAVVIVVMVEHGGHGSESSLPVAKALYDYLFSNDSDPIPNWPRPPGALRAGGALPGTATATQTSQGS